MQGSFLLAVSHKDTIGSADGLLFLVYFFLFLAFIDIVRATFGYSTVLVLFSPPHVDSRLESILDRYCRVQGISTMSAEEYWPTFDHHGSEDENSGPVINPLAEDADVLGLDSTVKTRKRRVVAKLDDTRLLGPRGIPYFKSHVVKRLKFKGKGHEKEDISQLLNACQAWAHGLFPKANFEDFLALTRKTGSTPAFARKRMEWISLAQRERAGEIIPDDGSPPQQPSSLHEETRIARDSRDMFPPNSDVENDLFISDDGSPPAGTKKITAAPTTSSKDQDDFPLDDEEEDLLAQFGL